MPRPGSFCPVVFHTVGCGWLSAGLWVFSVAKMVAVHVGY